MPFWFFSAVMLACLGTGLLVAGRDLLKFRAGAPEHGAEAATGA